MTTVEFTFEYGQKVHFTMLEKIAACLLDPPANVLDLADKMQEGQTEASLQSWQTHKGVLERLLQLGIPFSIKRVMANLSKSEPQAIVEKVVQSTRPETLPFNDRVHVAIAGLGLLQVRQVRLLEDACTDRLQEHLDSGWHILAVCPQPDQRRPDYILCFHGELDEKGNPISREFNPFDRP